MMHYVISSYLILLVALCKKVDASPVTSTTSANSVDRILPVHVVHFTARHLPNPNEAAQSSVLVPQSRSIHFFARALPAEMTSIDLPPSVPSSPPSSPRLPANHPANFYAKTVYSALFTALVSSVERMTLVRRMTDTTTAALQRLLQSKHDDATLPSSIVDHVNGICDAVAGQLTTSLSQSVALVAGQTTYNMLKPNADRNEGNAVNKPAIPVTKSFLIRWTVRRQARSAVHHVLQQITQTWSSLCRSLNPTDCQWLHTVVNDSWSSITRVLESSISGVLNPYQSKLEQVADTTAGNALSD
ncbi:hypothetical protein BDF22DRAFT_666596 [Syncephalis plumigaleata]|nr:hypothetical protein BDF22DRAFT_666596 [Syncephalis plumigaleata]